MTQIGELQTEGEQQTQQFSIIDLFALITFAAILLAVFAPVVRLMDPDKRAQALVPLSVQLFALVGACAYRVARRHELIRLAGKRLGVAFYGSGSWKHGPYVKSIVILLMLAAFQIIVAISITVGEVQPTTMVLNTLQLTYALSMFAVNFLWRVYPSTLEFFENGVVLHGSVLTTWKHVELRDSQFFDDRVVLVLKPQGTIGTDTKMARVSASLRASVEAQVDG